MKLILTSYLDGAPEEVDDRIDDRVETALAAAGRRVGAPEASATTDHVEQGIHIHTELGALDGTAVEWAGQSGLTELRVVVPWRPLGASRERTTLAASNFAAVLTDELRAA